jgi:ubiquinone/menaquinone biosynthesis C-methylase UbiE
MGFYTNFVFPRLCHLVMRYKRFGPYRERVVGAACGEVLEVGIGSGTNLPFYQEAACGVVGLEPLPRLIAMARRSASSSHVKATFIQGSAELIPLEDKSVDTVVSTFTLCSIPNVAAALAEMRRVLKPEGRLLFAEHGLAPDPNVRFWQDLLTPAWRPLAGGCHLNRPIATIIEDAGFRLERLETGYIPGPKPWTFLYEGSGTPS